MCLHTALYSFCFPQKYNLSCCFFLFVLSITSFFFIIFFCLSNNEISGTSLRRFGCYVTRATNETNLLVINLRDRTYIPVLGKKGLFCPLHLSLPPPRKKPKTLASFFCLLLQFKTIYHVGFNLDFDLLKGILAV